MTNNHRTFSRIAKAAAFCGAVVTGIIGLSGTAEAQGVSEPKWVKVCSKVAENEICNVQFNVLTNQGQLITGVNLLTSKGKVNRSIYQVAVPTGRYIPEGIKMRVDDGKENTLPYSLCLPDRCIAEIGLNDQLVKLLKGGGAIQLTSTNFRSQKNPVKVTLSGFTAAFDGPPLKREEAESRQKKIEEELKKKSDEIKKRLKEAQDKAKGN